MKPESLSVKAICEQWNISSLGDIVPFLAEDDIKSVGTLPKKYPTKTKNSAKKIAWLLKNGWKKPIGADLGCPSFRDCPWPFSNDLDDHKFAAAFIRGDAFIEADVSGEVDWISTFK